MKYKQPSGISTQEFVLAFPRHIGESISKKHRCLTTRTEWENAQPSSFEKHWRWIFRNGVNVVVTGGAK